MGIFVSAVIIVLISCGSVHSQSLTLADLIKLNNLNEDEFDTFATEKGFNYDGLEGDEYAKVKSYVFYVNGVKTSYLSKINYLLETKQMVSFQTPTSKAYLSIKADSKKLGFSYARTETKENITFMYYTKGPLELSLVSSTDESRPVGTVRTFYEIFISKKN